MNIEPMKHNINIKKLKNEKQTQLLEVCINAYRFTWNGYGFFIITLTKDQIRVLNNSYLHSLLYNLLTLRKKAHFK